MNIFDIENINIWIAVATFFISVPSSITAAISILDRIEQHQLSGVSQAVGTWTNEGDILSTERNFITLEWGLFNNFQLSKTLSGFLYSTRNGCNFNLRTIEKSFSKAWTVKVYEQIGWRESLIGKYQIKLLKNEDRIIFQKLSYNGSNEDQQKLWDNLPAITTVWREKYYSIKN